jgi:hypothetical protein
MNLDKGKKVFQVFIGEKSQGLLSNPVIAGHAIHYEGDNHYLLKLMMILTVSYFLAKNPNSQTSYTVFTKCYRASDRLKIQKPLRLRSFTSSVNLNFGLFRDNVNHLLTIGQIYLKSKPSGKLFSNGGSSLLVVGNAALK